MRRTLVLLSALAVLGSPLYARPRHHHAAAQAVTAPQRDPQAVAILRQAIVAMGGAAPSDSVATGTITTTAGGLTETGTITILTRGVDQSSEQIQTPSGFTIVYSQGRAATIKNGTLASASLNLAVTAQSAYFPLPLFVAALENPDTQLHFIGLEMADGSSAYHLQFSNTFASIPDLQPLASSCQRDLWIDPSTALPRKISYARSLAAGPAAGTAIAVSWSAYKNVNGVAYPFSVQVSINGTPWATVSIRSVNFNTGLSDAQFPVQ